MEAGDAVGAIVLMLAWFASTKLGRWLIGLGAVALAALALAYAMFRKGKRVQADADKTKDAAEQVKQAKSAQEAYQAASEAAERVQQDAAKQAAPDVVKRNDFESDF